MNTQPNQSPNGVLATAWLLAGIVPAAAVEDAARPAPTPSCGEPKPQDAGREPFDGVAHPLS